MTPQEFFDASGPAEEIYRAVIDALGAHVTQATVTTSQIAFRELPEAGDGVGFRERPFAWVWRPGQYLHATVAPLVLTVALDHRDPSPRWKEIVEPRPGRFTHHLELHDRSDVDAQVIAWLNEARAAARQGRR